VDLTRDLLTKTGQDVIAVPRVAGLTTTSLPALRAYLEGEAAFRKADFAGAVAAYERAVDMDSTFALGWARLAGSYGWLENVSSRQMARAAERATTLLDQLPARQRIIVDANRAMSERDLSIEGPLRAAVQQYPDDPDLWYLLGDFFRHFGEDAGLASWEEDLDAFRHAVALDPTFAPYYIHLIEGEIGAGDTAAAKAALEAYQEASSGQDPEPYIPVAFRIYLGSPAERQAALAGLDSLSERDLFQMANSVRWDGLPDPAWQREVALKAIALHHQGVWLNRLLELDLRAGRIHLAGEDLSAPDESDYYRMQHAVSFQTLAISLAPEYLALARDPEVCGTRLDAGAGCMLAMGMAAAERGDRKEWRRWMERNDSLDRLYRSQNAPGHGEEHRLIARAIEGWWADRQEHDVDKARALLAEASDLPAFAGPVRWRLAELLAESRPARALEMFRRMSGAYLPYAQVRVGKIQEALGDTASARAAYRKAADLLVDADPDLLWAQEARDGVTRLGG
jgi:tetratricopeptide (TPR) repeat protein